ncbi:uncharacterized protein LOC108108474 [Drosophila eugracilis]|uniref:uncharacterized protein LOC108108474 n=1 Tax=Drosophila eugracilis TaxID=29029 RepID=UPI0007E84EF4|nr:uncharacterized protein LOC108108474 [Drosophila eugracilis]
MWMGLESLELMSCTLSNELPDCPNLTFLHIHSETLHDKNYFLKYILKNGKTLKMLCESCDPRIDSEGFLQILRDCPKLRNFSTPMPPMKLHPEYVSSIVQILKDNGVTREDPLKLVLFKRKTWKRLRRLLRRNTDKLIDLSLII